ncbi:MAG TPA: glycosyltransferase family 2 protein [Phycisphaerales bacterium]|nr:glycosyltransferase family 2 protein [Phycisphaerales bacterium]
MFWNIYNYVAYIAIASQVFFMLRIVRNYRYALRKSSKEHVHFHPRTLLTVPCKGVDSAFDKNIRSLFALDYDNFYLNFVVEDESDEAYNLLCRLKNELAQTSKAIEVNVLVAGLAAGCSQKIHNLLHSCSNAHDDVEIFAFADSDACLRANWLSHIVYPLRKDHQGAATGYRWFVPVENNLASLALSAVNAKVAQLLGATRFNQVWGGSMAIRRKTFYDIGLDTIWQKALSDDLCLSHAVKKAHKRIIFVPACLVASYETTTWPKLFEFVRRQFLITRITIPGTWWFGLFSNVYSIAGLWGGLAAAITAAATQTASPLYWMVPLVFVISQELRAILRQKMIVKLMPEDADQLKKAINADVFGTFVWSWFLLACIITSAFGRTITWRGIKYKLMSPTETIIVG